MHKKYPENYFAMVDFAVLQVARLKFQYNWVVAQRDLLEKLKENNVAKVSLIKLLSKINLLVCFH